MFGDQVWAKGSKIGPKTRFLPFFQVWFISFPWNCSDSLQQWMTSSSGKTSEKSFWGPTLGQNVPKPGPKLDFFTIFSSLVH